MAATDELPTPFILIREEILNRNITHMQNRANKYGCRLRPHVKTHKSVFIAEKQLKAGAAGITVAKISEAEIFLKAGIKDVTIAYPVISSSLIMEVLGLAVKKNARLQLACDSLHGFRKISEAAGAFSGTVPLYLIIDTGFHRCGFTPGSERLIELASAIAADDHTTLYGLLTHGGQSYNATSPAEAKMACQTEVLEIQKARKQLEEAGIAVPLVSIGSTPGLLSEADLSGVGEIRPGNYVYLDCTTLNMGLIEEKDIALSVVSTVVSENDRYWIVDAGSKMLSSDGGAHGIPTDKGFGRVGRFQNNHPAQFPLTMGRLSEEHGWIPKKRKNALSLGDRVAILPNHSCVVPNLAGRFWLHTASGGIKEYPVDARGCSQ